MTTRLLPIPLTRSLALVSTLIAAAAPALPQSVVPGDGRTRSGVVHAELTGSVGHRRVVNSLPSSSSARHVIQASGSYVLSADIQCGPGQSGIEIGPLATSVELYFNGYTIRGDAGRTSPHAVQAAQAAPGQPAFRLHLVDVAAHTFSGHAIHVEGRPDVRLEGGVLEDGDADGVHVLDADSLVIRDVSVRRFIARGIKAEVRRLVDVSSSRVQECGTGIEACTADLRLEGCEVSDTAQDGLVFSDACSLAPLPPTTRKAISTKGTGFARCAGNGISVVGSGGGDIDVSLQSTDISVTGLDGVSIRIPPLPDKALRVRLEDVGVASCGGTGIFVESVSAGGSFDVSAMDVHVEDSSLAGLDVRRQPLVCCSGHVTLMKFTDVEDLGDGLRLSGVQADLSDVSVHRAGGTGITLTDCAVNARRVTCLGALGQDGFRLERTSGRMTQCVSSGNAGDGLEDTDGGIAPTFGEALMVTECSFQENGGVGARLVRDDPRRDWSMVSCEFGGNAGGGLLSTSSGGSCTSVSGRVEACTFEGNGGVACELSNVRGGRVNGCLVVGGSTGIRVGDGSGLGCTSGVEVSECTVHECGTGIEVLDGGEHMVVSNVVTGSLVGLSVPDTVNNLVGPTLSTTADMAGASSGFGNVVR